VTGVGITGHRIARITGQDQGSVVAQNTYDGPEFSSTTALSPGITYNYWICDVTFHGVVGTLCSSTNHNADHYGNDSPARKTSIRGAWERSHRACTGEMPASKSIWPAATLIISVSALDCTIAWWSDFTAPRFPITRSSGAKNPNSNGWKLGEDSGYGFGWKLQGGLP